MENESLAELKAAFEDWRSKKRFKGEAVPAELLERARSLAVLHGPTAVHRATRVDPARIKIGRKSRDGAGTAQVPAFSRVELSPPTMKALPFAEIDTPAGLRLRLFIQSDEALALLTSLCSQGGGR